MATTELSLMATPGMPHTFSPKGAAVVSDGFVCGVIGLTGTVVGRVSIAGTVSGTATIVGTVGGRAKLSECE